MAPGMAPGKMGVSSGKMVVALETTMAGMVANPHVGVVEAKKLSSKETIGSLPEPMSKEGWIPKSF